MTRFLSDPSLANAKCGLKDYLTKCYLSLFIPLILAYHLHARTCVVVCAVYIYCAMC